MKPEKNYIEIEPNFYCFCLRVSKNVRLPGVFKLLFFSFSSSVVFEFGKYRRDILNKNLLYMHNFYISGLNNNNLHRKKYNKSKSVSISICFFICKFINNNNIEL